MKKTNTRLWLSDALGLLNGCFYSELSDMNNYICIIDIICAQEGGDMERTNVVIQNWMRLKDTIEFLGFWEQLSNPNFNCIEFEAIKASAGTNRFILTAKEWCSRTGAIGIISKAGRYGGTYAHKDIAYNFGQ